MGHIGTVVGSEQLLGLTPLDEVTTVAVCPTNSELLATAGEEKPSVLQDGFWPGSHCEAVGFARCSLAEQAAPQSGGSPAMERATQAFHGQEIPVSRAHFSLPLSSI